MFFVNSTCNLPSHKTNRRFARPWSSKYPTYAVNWCSPCCKHKHHSPKQIVSTLTFDLERRLKVKVDEVGVLVTQRIYSRLHSFTQYFVFTAFDMHRFTTLAKKREGTTTRESRDARNTNAGYPRGTITSQVCSASYLVYPSECNGL